MKTINKNPKMVCFRLMYPLMFSGAVGGGDSLQRVSYGNMVFTPKLNKKPTQFQCLPCREFFGYIPLSNYKSHEN